MNISENSQRRRRGSTFSSSGYLSENTSSDEESIPEWIWREPKHTQPMSSSLRTDRISSQTSRQGIFEPSNQESVYQRSLKHLPPVFERYQQEIYRTREPITREPRGVRPLATRRLRPFESGYKTNDLSDEESSIPDRLWSETTRRRSTLDSGFEEHIQPSTQQLEYQQFLQQLPPAFARYQQEIYGPRDPITGQSLGAEPIPLTTSSVSVREPYTSTPLTTRRLSPLETRIQSEQEPEPEEIDEDNDLTPNIQDMIMNRAKENLPYLEADKQLLSDLGFDVNHQIGYGGFADVYKGVCNEYAFKRYRDESTADPNDPNSGEWKEVSLKGKYFALKFMIFDIEERENIDEAKYMLEFNHINVVDIYCVISGIIPPSASHDSRRIRLYIMMEFSELGDINTFIEHKKAGFLSAILYKEIVRQTIEGLLYIHSKNICHADIKEVNILVFTDERTGDYVFKYSDFGLSISTTDAVKYEYDLQDLCLLWRSLLEFVTNDNGFTQQMRQFLDNLPGIGDWIYQTLQSMIDQNPWLFQ